MSVHIGIVRLPHARDLPLPQRASPGSSGYDLRAAIAEEGVTLRPGDRLAIPTGLVVAIPRGYEGQVRPRSGHALRSGLGVINAPGTIDADYRGEVAVLLINLGREPVRIERGDRIAQLVIAAVPDVLLEERQGLEELGETDRGASGFGSTGAG
jgi:dUTP pyrophosphatase